MHPQLKLLVVGSALVSGLVVVIFSVSCDQEIQSRVEYRPDQGGVRAKAERSRSNTDGSASSATSRRLAGAPVTPLVIEESLKQWLPDANNTLPNFYTRSVRKPAYDRRYRDGILVFLHHNKAAGTSTKACLEDLVHDRSLTGSLAVLNKSGRLEVEKAIGQGDQFSILMGGYAFGICDKVPNQMCSYFTMLRDPYERVISSYNYCRRRHNDDQTCRGLLAEDVTLKEWALHQGTYFFWQLLIKPWFCVTDKALAVNPAFADFTDTPHTPGTTFNNTPCWFREKVILKRSLSREQMDVLLAYCVSHLEDWFSVIGLSTEYDLTLTMLEDIYQMPFRQKCLHIHGHRKKVDTSDMKRELEEDPDVYEALRGDLIIYEKAKEIFERQKETYLKKKTPKKLQTEKTEK